MINKPSFLIHRLTIGGKGAGLKDDKKLNCLAKVLADAAKGTGRAVSSSDKSPCAFRLETDWGIISE